MAEEEKKKSDEVDQKPAKSKKFWCCCCSGIFAFFIFVIISQALVFRGFFGSSNTDNIQPSAPSTSTKPSSTSNNPSTPSQSYPEPEPCQSLSNYSASPLTLNTQNPGYKEKIETTNYIIHGYTATDLRSQMSTCGTEQDGKRYDANASYYINSQYLYNVTNKGCSAKNVTVGLHVNFHVPKWDQPSEFVSGLDGKWTNYMNLLQGHEDGHKELSQKYAQQIYNTMVDYPASTACDDLAIKINATVNQILQTLTDEQVSYDEATGHGRTQGAVFP